MLGFRDVYYIDHLITGQCACCGAIGRWHLGPAQGRPAPHGHLTRQLGGGSWGDALVGGSCRLCPGHWHASCGLHRRLCGRSWAGTAKSISPAGQCCLGKRRCAVGGQHSQYQQDRHPKFYMFHRKLHCPLCSGLYGSIRVAIHLPCSRSMNKRGAPRLFLERKADSVAG